MIGSEPITTNYVVFPKIREEFLQLYRNLFSTHTRTHTLNPIRKNVTRITFLRLFGRSGLKAFFEKIHCLRDISLLPPSKMHLIRNTWIQPLDKICAFSLSHEFLFLINHLSLSLFIYISIISLSLSTYMCMPVLPLCIFVCACVCVFVRTCICF